MSYLYADMASRKNQIFESPDSVNLNGNYAGWQYGNDNPIVFIYDKETRSLLVSDNGDPDEQYITHGQLTKKRQGKYRSEDRYDEMKLCGRYYPKMNVISFWESPQGREGARNLSYVVGELKGNRVPIDTKTLLVDVWENNAGWNSENRRSESGYSSKIGGFIPYQWFFDGFLDDFGSEIVSIMPLKEYPEWFIITFTGYRTYWAKRDGILCTYEQFCGQDKPLQNISESKNMKISRKRIDEIVKQSLNEIIGGKTNWNYYDEYGDDEFEGDVKNRMRNSQRDDYSRDMSNNKYANSKERYGQTEQRFRVCWKFVRGWNQNGQVVSESTQEFDTLNTAITFAKYLVEQYTGKGVFASELRIDVLEDWVWKLYKSYTHFMTSVDRIKINA